MRNRSNWLAGLVLVMLSLLIAMPTIVLADDGNRGQGRARQQDRRGNEDQPGRGRAQQDRNRDQDQRGRSNDAQTRIRVVDADGERDRRDDERRGRADDAEVHVRLVDGDDDEDGGRVTVCHWTGSDTNPFVLLTIAAPGARAHERHGDVVVNLDLDIDTDVVALCSRETGAGGLQPPSSVALASTTETSVTLAWMPSAHAVTYLVLVATRPEGPFIPAAVSNLTPAGATVVGLMRGVEYYFQVRAIDAHGSQSAVSNTIAASPGSSVGTVVPPMGVAVVNTTATTARLRWAPSPGASSFVVLQATNPAGPFVVSAIAEMGPRSARVIGLSPGTTYYFQVRAVAPSGFQTGPSNLASGTTLL